MFFNKFFKRPNTFWIILVGIFLSYIIVGVGVYLWQNTIVKETKKNKESVVSQVLSEKEKMERETSELRKETEEKLEKYKNNEIDLATAKVGDRLANGMVVTKAGPYIIEFSGKIVISGNYEYDTVPGKKLVCLFPDLLSKEKAPKIYNMDSVDPDQICFSNQEIAKNRFGPPGSKGETVVAVDNYQIACSDGCAHYAELIKTIEKKP